MRPGDRPPVRRSSNRPLNVGPLQVLEGPPGQAALLLVWHAAPLSPDALDGTRSDTDGFRHHSSTPTGRLGGRIGPGERHNTLGDIRPEWWDARGSCLITQEAVVTRLHEAFLPPPHTGLRLAGPAPDTVCRHAYAVVCDPARSWSDLRVMEIPVR